MKKTYAIISVCCFAVAVLYGIGMCFLYDRLAHIYQNPANAYVNLTALAGILGTILLIGGGIFSAVKALGRSGKR